MAEESVQSTADVVTRSTASVYQSAAPTQASSYLEGIVAEQLYQVTTLPRTPLLFHPAIVILIVAVGSQALKVFGHENVVALLSPLHTIVFHYKTAKTQTQLKRDLFTTRQQLNQTSSQDEFAKWAKLRRKVDKDLADLEAVSEYHGCPKHSPSTYCPPGQVHLIVSHLPPFPPSCHSRQDARVIPCNAKAFYTWSPLSCYHRPATLRDKLLPQDAHLLASANARRLRRF